MGGQLSGLIVGTAASRFQSARRPFPKDDLFFREYLFAKCWEQGLHRRYGELLLCEAWAPLRDRYPSFREEVDSRAGTPLRMARQYGADLLGKAMMRL